MCLYIRDSCRVKGGVCSYSVCSLALLAPCTQRSNSWGRGRAADQALQIVAHPVRAVRQAWLSKVGCCFIFIVLIGLFCHISERAFPRRGRSYCWLPALKQAGIHRCRWSTPVRATTGAVLVLLPATCPYSLLFRIVFRRRRIRMCPYRA